MSHMCRAFSRSKLGRMTDNNRMAFYAGWKAREIEVDALVEQMRALRDALSKASRTFCHYAALHAAKEPADIDKANANNDLHEMCESALATGESL